MEAEAKVGRRNQRQRTRKDLLQAASRLMKQGLKPNLDEIAAEALVSRATAYRYFPNVAALHVEAALDVATPEAEALFPGGLPTDPVERLQRVDAAFHDMTLANEVPLRMMLVHSLERVVRGEVDPEHPARQNRRTPLIEAALEPARDQFDPEALEIMTKALALFVGTEGMIVCKDVLQLDDADARAVKRWAIAALVEAAKRPENQCPTAPQP
jgi:AcrR family transcriptional regulator